MNTEFFVNTVLIIVGVALVSFVMWVGLEDAGDATRKGVMSAIAAAGCILLLIALRKALLALFLIVLLIPVVAQAQVSRDALKIEIGHKLFFDSRISLDNSTSCASCHDPARGWSDGRRVAVGLIKFNPQTGRTQGIPGTRNTPTAMFSAHQLLQFHDQRTTGVKRQCTQPMANPIEMGNQTVGQVVTRLRRIPGYQQLFAAAYGQQVTQDNLAESITAFERTLVTPLNAPIDRYLEGDGAALSDAATRGYAIFARSSCIECHKYPLFRDDLCHNTGIASRFGENDRGRAAINQQSNADIRAFKTPTLREIARTAPYTHSGRLQTLYQVAEHYNAGARFVTRDGVTRRDQLADARIRPLGLDQQGIADLATFLAEGFSSPDYPNLARPVLP